MSRYLRVYKKIKANSHPSWVTDASPINEKIPFLKDVSFYPDDLPLMFRLITNHETKNKRPVYREYQHPLLIDKKATAEGDFIVAGNILFLCRKNKNISLLCGFKNDDVKKSFLELCFASTT